MSDIQLDVETSIREEGPVSRTLAGDAWHDLRHSWIFWISAVLLVFVMMMVLFPGLMASQEATSSLTGGCQLSNSLAAPSEQFKMGADQQGCDVYSLSVYGARPSVTVGVIAAVSTTIIGAGVGLLAGFFGGKTDSVISRIIDIFLGVPYILGAIVLLSAVDLPGIWGVVLALTLLSWPTAARLVRGKVIEAKGQDYTLAARALGASNGRIMLRHILPNAIGPSHRGRGDQPGPVHRRRGDPVLPGSRHPSAGLLVGHDDRRCAELVLPGALDPVGPCGLPDHHRSGLHPAG